MKREKIIKCKHCQRRQKIPFEAGMTDEMLFWHQCSYCHKRGLSIQEIEQLSFKEFFLGFYRYYRFRYFSKF